MMKVAPEEVANYLMQNPEFFESYAPMLAEIHIPHPHGGRAISISERQQLALREKAKLLEDRLRELVQFGEENDAISEKVHRFSLALIRSQGLDALLHTLYFNLREDFAVPHVALRVWGHELPPELTPKKPEFIFPSPELQAYADALVNPYCGPHAPYESPSWFGEESARLRSFAVVALRDTDAFGMMVIASEDPQRFYPEMGVLYLKRLGELVSAALFRYIKSAAS